MRIATALCLLSVLLAFVACEREQKAIEQDLPATRAAKARADVQQIAAAVRVYQASSGALPPSLETLTQPQTGGGGPLLGSIPAAPAGWSAYQYVKQSPDRFSVSSSGGGVTVSAPE